MSDIDKDKLIEWIKRWNERRKFKAIIRAIDYKSFTQSTTAPEPDKGVSE